MHELIEQVKLGELGRDFLRSQGPKSAFDCGQCISRCKGECCGPCPIPKDTWARHQGDVQGEVKDVIDDGAGFVHVVTTTGNCAFKSPEGRCVIYPQDGAPDERADVCRRFGDESHPMLTCRWQDKHGRVRPRDERRRLGRKLVKIQNRTLARLREEVAHSGGILPLD